ncbi:MAG: exodeoxyribonuclease VII large subunit [Cellvibrio sp.]|nr:exodeoxyribonuclease VII large subunit [Cellvibrio sp.]
MNNLPPSTQDLSQNSGRDIITVSQLNRRARQLLETHLALLWVEGELSNVSTPSSGHWYFTLKDAQAQVRCAMFRNRNMTVKCKPQQGMQVVIRARVSLYEERGDYQIIAEHMEEAGTGILQRNFEALKQKLFLEGLFAQEHKKSLPRMPKHIAIITSPTGAAIRDILQILDRRFALIPVTLIPVAVQGKDSAPQIVHALEIANHTQLFDVIILGRGGGSLEDLWSFNEEVVARAIYASETPVVSAVGHETDITIADFVADLRAPTPSAAAELVVPDSDELLDQFIGLEVLLEESIQRKLEFFQQKLHWLQSRLRHPKSKLEQASQRLDHLESRLKQKMQSNIRHYQNHLHTLSLRQAPWHPKNQLQRLQQRLLQANQQLKNSQQHLLDKKKQAFQTAVRVLNTLSPLKTLDRGYALVTHEGTQIPITSTKQIKTGSQLTTRVAEGEFSCEVTKIIR